MTCESILSLGSNLGDRLGWLQAARTALAALPATRLIASSRVYETEPVDVPEAWRAEGFLNAVVVVETSLAVEAFSDAIHAIEATLGRIRSPEHHAPRTVDIDILSFGDLTSDRPDLRLPHPGWALRRFVCAPLADVRPDLVIPGQTRPVSAILAALPPEPAAIPAARQWEEEKAGIPRESVGEKRHVVRG
jgi:2-amino-4-hydroxy-6-hydroxymethyldihydropteridine diphosphokinase